MKKNWADIYNTWQSHCLQLAAAVLKDEALAADVVQDVFLHFLQTDLHPGFIQNIPAVLKRSVYNKCIDLIRKRKNVCGWSRSLDEIEADNSTQYEIQYRQTKRYYEQAVSELPRKRREVHLLQASAGLREKEIAVLLSIGLPTVKDHLAKSRYKLREVLMHLRAWGNSNYWCKLLKKPDCYRPDGMLFWAALFNSQ